MRGYGRHQEEPTLSDPIGRRWIAGIVVTGLFFPSTACAQSNDKSANAEASQSTIKTEESSRPLKMTTDKSQPSKLTAVKSQSPKMTTDKSQPSKKAAESSLSIKKTVSTLSRVKKPVLAKAKPVMLALNFRDAPIDEILKTYSIASGLTVIKDPGLQGSATVVSPHPIAISQAFVILDALLDSRGYNATQANGMLKITAKRGGGPGGGSGMMNGGPGGGGMMNGGPGGGNGMGAPGVMSGRSNDQTQVFQLKYASAKSVASLVNDLFKNAASGTTVSSGGRSGGPGGGMGGPGGGMMGGPGGGQMGGNSSGNSDSGNASSASNASRSSVARASSDDYSNSVIVTGPSSQITQIEQVIDQIDQPVGSKLITQIFPIQYVDVSEISTVISGVLTASANGGVGSSSSSQSSMPFEMRAMMNGGSSSSSGNQVVASSETNSLIVTATETQLDLTQKVINELDKPKKIISSTYVRTLSNASATDVAQLLVSMYGNKTNVTSSSTSKTSSKTTTSSFGTSSSSSGFGNNSGSGSSFGR